MDEMSFHQIIKISSRGPAAGGSVTLSYSQGTPKTLVMRTEQNAAHKIVLSCTSSSSRELIAALPESDTSDTRVAKVARLKWSQGFLLTVLFTAAICFTVRLVGVIDTDLWWHMAVGRWIVDHRAIPYTEPFSGKGLGKPFEAYSWLFELVVYWSFQKFGLVGIVMFTSATAVAITAAIHHLVWRLNSTFLPSIGITFLSICAMGRLYTPRPWLPSILFFALELDILMRARENGESRELYWLPLIFAVWVNLHIQFIDGLVVLGIAMAEALLAARWKAIQTNFRVGRMSLIFGGCVAATLVNPYGPRIYKVAYDLVAQGSGLPQLPELAAIPFRTLDDWCVLFLALAATVALARARKPSLFEVVLLAFSVIVSFRSQRDIWVLAVSGAALLASNLAEHPEDRFLLTASSIPLLSLSTMAAAALVFFVMGGNETKLHERLGKSLPVQAVDVIEAHGWSGPLYNDYGWGGYLIWSMQQPVNIYGRNTVYGVQSVLRSDATWNGHAGWDSDPDLLQANLIIAKRGAPLVQLLQLQPCMQAAYEDQVTAVFIPRNVPAETVTSPITRFCAARNKSRIED